ncbi:class I SAM-dependent methyltransferase [Bosea sp. 2YAB26]|uniref:class I SAM-dependent methyltransferase n=1 Tax=Bosea sp. 2YAB26 TaxID=3237478 RepID=UPI003F8F21EF
MASAETTSISVAKFDADRAAEYLVQSRIALAGYEACHELSACMLAATLGPGSAARVLAVGAGGGGQEIVSAASLEPDWRFVAVDPSAQMMDVTAGRLQELGFLERTEIAIGYVEELPAGRDFDAATLIGVLHHLPGKKAKGDILDAIASRLKPGAPLILAGNRFAYAAEPLLLAAWAERWRMHGARPDEVEAKRAKILQGADPPASENEVAALLEAAGFGPPTWYFSSLFWGACLAPYRG